MKASEVDAWFGYQGGQPGDDVHGRTNAAGAGMRRSGEIQWLENHMGGAIVVRCLELVADLPIAGQ